MYQTLTVEACKMTSISYYSVNCILVITVALGYELHFGRCLYILHGNFCSTQCHDNTLNQGMTISFQCHFQCTTQPTLQHCIILTTASITNSWQTIKCPTYYSPPASTTVNNNGIARWYLPHTWRTNNLIPLQYSHSEGNKLCWDTSIELLTYLQFIYWYTYIHWNWRVLHSKHACKVTSKYNFLIQVYMVTNRGISRYHAVFICRHAYFFGCHYILIRFGVFQSVYKDYIESSGKWPV
jgi:hypothetical protein